MFLPKLFLGGIFMSNISVGAVRARKIDVKKLAVLALFIAFGYISLFVFRIKVSFLTLEFKDVFITMAGFVYGPLAAAAVALIETLLELFTVASTGFWGAIMNFAGSAAFAVTASLIYKYNRSFTGAVIGLVTSVFSMTAIMLVMNLIITPIYTHTSVKVVVGMILPLLLPFNLTKSILNAALTFVLYKPLSQALKSAHIIPHSDSNFAINKKTVCGLVIASLIVIASVAVMIVLLGGNFELVKSN
jgi:riboflavin transporter FmnP